VATDNTELAHTIRIGRDYGNPGNYDCQFTGLNARMSELHAAVGLASLDGLDDRIAYRNDLVAAFKARAAGVPGLGYQELRHEDVSTFKDLTLIIDPDSFGICAADLGRSLAAEGIDSRRYYHPPIHRQKAYAHLLKDRELPVTDEMADRVLTPPLYSHMSVDQIGRVADAVVAIHEHASAVRNVLG
jgi:dTDP-4-amino-4,6-dideoxygalactose transaminase